MKEKECTKCGKTKPIEQFYYMKTQQRYKAACKSCEKRKKRDAYKENTLITKTCDLCQDEFWTGNLHSYKIETVDYRTCGECRDQLLRGDYEKPEDYSHDFERTDLYRGMSPGEMEDFRTVGDYSENMDKKHEESMASKGLYRHLKPGDPDFDEMAKLYGG